MKIKAFFATLLATVALSIANVGFIAAQNGAPARSGRSAAVILQCRNYGGQQDVAKNPDIINTTTATIPSGKNFEFDLNLKLSIDEVGNECNHNGEIR